MMKQFHLVVFCLAVLLAASSKAHGDAKEGFVPLFNGRNLKGWVNANCAPETFTVVNGMIHCTGQPTGALRTDRQYENFVLELEWRHLNSGGNSGVFIWASPIAAPGVPFLRAIEVQVLDHGYNVPGKNEWYTTNGDVFPIHGSKMTPFGRHNGDRSFPSEERSKGSPEWNHYRIECNNGVLRLHVNGKEVSGGENCSYRKGYLGLESEGAPIDFRNMRIKELPPSDAPPEQTAPADLGWRPLFTGLDLRGWKLPIGAASRWRARGEHLELLEGTTIGDSTIWTEQQFGDAEFVLDCRESKPGVRKAAISVCVGGTRATPIPLLLDPDHPGSNNRFVITVRKYKVTVTRNGKDLVHLTLSGREPKRGAFGLNGMGSQLEFMNLYVRSVR